MKKILIAALTGFALFSAPANAQTSQVCRKTKDKKTSCYHTRYAENFKVCKNDAGYHICGEMPTYANTSKGSLSMKQPMPTSNDAYSQNMDMQSDENGASNGYAFSRASTSSGVIAPQSQSYPSAAPVFGVVSETAYEGYYPGKGRIKVTYSNNVAEESRAPYEGLPSPQDDGPVKNEERNINAYNTNANLAPLTGRPE